MHRPSERASKSFGSKELSPAPERLAPAPPSASPVSGPVTRARRQPNKIGPRAGAADQLSPKTQAYIGGQTTAATNPAATAPLHSEPSAARYARSVLRPYR